MLLENNKLHFDNSISARILLHHMIPLLIIFLHALGVGTEGAKNVVFILRKKKEKKTVLKLLQINSTLKSNTQITEICAHFGTLCT